MTDFNENTTEELLAYLNTIAWNRGRIQGMKEVSAELLKMAGDAFARGKDDDALFARGMSKTVTHLAANEEKVWVNEYKMKTEIWAELKQRINLDALGETNAPIGTQSGSEGST